MNRFCRFDIQKTLFLNKQLLKGSNYEFCSTLVNTDELSNDKQQIEDSDEIKKKCDVSRLPENIRQIYVKKQMFPLKFLHHYQLRNLRKCYARFGKKSGINPGLMWPSKEYLDELKLYQDVSHTPLKEMLAKVREKEQQELQYRKEREEFIEKNMAMLDTWMKEFEANKEKKQAEAIAQKLRKQKLIEEVQDYIGFKMDPKDERFKEVLAMKEEEEKKAKKKLRKQEREQKMLAKLLQATQEKSADDKS